MPSFGTVTGAATYYAQLTAMPREYSIIYRNVDGATNSNPASYTYGSGFTLAKPSKSGHIFGGWYASEELTGEAVVAISDNSTGAVTLYAKWRPKT